MNRNTQTRTDTFLNVAGYQFVPLDNLALRRRQLREQCRELDLKGTILLSTEGINLFVAGEPHAVGRLLEHLRSDPLLADLEVKESYSDHQPFNRMLVKVKKEIIAFDVPEIDPRHRPAPKLTPQELREWINEGRPLTLLDVRNDYEIQLGTFSGAKPIGIDHFREFPKAAEQLPPQLKEQPIVMFCTGGIRCEKAGPYMQQAGFENVFQLDGGILKYFEDCGGEHYDGDCFVFDQRVAVDSDLQETDAAQCFVCQRPLTAQDQASPLYRPGRSCPYCHVPEDEQMRRTCEERNQAIARFADPLPGSRPYDNERPLNVPRRYAGWKLLEFLCSYHSHIDSEEWNRVIQGGRIRCGDQVLNAEDRVKEGQRLVRLFPATVEPDVSIDVQVLYEDEALVLVNKPGALPMHPCGQYNRNSLQYILRQVYQREVLRPAHRLDANTTGLVVFSRSRRVASVVQSQFEQGSVEKRYLARVEGQPTNDEFVCCAPISRSPGACGCRVIDDDGLPAETRFKVTARLSDQSSLLEVMPITGRTNQIRAHLWHLQMPIVGDPTYLPQHELGRQQTLGPQDPPMCLQAAFLRFRHPLTNTVMEFTASAPSWVDDNGGR